MLSQIPRYEWPNEARERNARGKIVAAVRGQIAQESDELVKDRHLSALRALVGRDRGVAEELRQQLADPLGPAMELAAAMSLAANPKSVPVEAIDVLTRSLMRGEEIEDAFNSDDPWVEDRHQRLTEIYLYATSITNPGVATLGRFPKLKVIYVNKISIADGGS